MNPMAQGGCLNLDNPHFFEFLKIGHAVKAEAEKAGYRRIYGFRNPKIVKGGNSITAQKEFNLGGVDFLLEYIEYDWYHGGESNGWFSLYRVVAGENGMTSYQMCGSDFYGLGRKDIHDIADDGGEHIKKYITEVASR